MFNRYLLLHLYKSYSLIFSHKTCLLQHNQWQLSCSELRTLCAQSIWTFFKLSERRGAYCHKSLETSQVHFYSFSKWELKCFLSDFIHMKILKGATSSNWYMSVKSLLHHLLVMWPWARWLASFDLTKPQSSPTWFIAITWQTPCSHLFLSHILSIR